METNRAFDYICALYTSFIAETQANIILPSNRSDENAGTENEDKDDERYVKGS